MVVLKENILLIPSFSFFSSFVLVMISWHQQHIIHGVDWKRKMVYTIGETIDLHLSHLIHSNAVFRVKGQECKGVDGQGSIMFNGESSYPLKLNFQGPVYCTMDMSVP